MARHVAQRALGLRVPERVGRVLLTIAAVLFVIGTAIILTLSVWFTVTFADPLSELATIGSWVTDAPAMARGSVGFFVSAAALAGLYLVADKVDERVLVAVVLAGTTAFGLFVVLTTQAAGHGFPDAQSLITYASLAVEGKWDTFLPGSSALAPAVPSANQYFSWYPFQFGCFVCFLCVFRAFGAGNVMALELLNVVANEVTIASLVGITWSATSSRRARNMVSVLLGAFLPLVLSAALPYGNVMGFSLVCLFLLAQVRSLASQGGRSFTWQALSFVPLTLGLAIKSTYILVALGACATWLVLSLVKGRWRELVAAVLVVVVAHSLAGMPLRVFEERTGYGFGDGIPTASWIEIGLTPSDETGGQPGWWDHAALKDWEASQGDSHRCGELAKEGIGEALRDFSQDPSYACSFFVEKLATEWAEPTYQTLMYLKCNTKVVDGTWTFTDISWLDTEALNGYLDGIQTVVYLGALAEAIWLLGRRGEIATGEGETRCALAISLMTFSGVAMGFACYVVWEAKSFYLLPFVILMIPLSACGHVHLLRHFAHCLGQVQDD